MPSFNIVPAFYVFEDRRSGFCPRVISVKIDLFCFKGMEKGFTASIIITVSFTSHALSGTGSDEFFSKGGTGILYAPIRIDDQSLARLSPKSGR